MINIILESFWKTDTLKQRYEAMKVDENKIYEVLDEIGLSKRKADIYLFLTQKGLQKAQSIASYLGIDRAQTYRLLKSLKNEGILEETIETPSRYNAIPITNLLESHIINKKREVASLEEDKESIINYCNSLNRKKTAPSVAKFQVITNTDGVYKKISQMVDAASSDVSALTTSTGLIHEDAYGITDMIMAFGKKKKNIKFRLLANITQDNLEIAKNILKHLPLSRNVIWKHTSVGSKHYPRFLIKDDEEVLLYMNQNEKKYGYSKEVNGLWVASKMFVSTLKRAFVDIWSNSVDINDRIKNLETGVPLKETIVIKDSIETGKKIRKILENAENEITLISSSVGIIKLDENNFLEKYSQEKLKLRLMASIDFDNLSAAKNLSKIFEVKHVSINYLTMMIVDGKHLFIFKAPPPDVEIKYPFYFAETFYSNDENYVERVNELINEIWKRGTAISEVGSANSFGAPLVEVSESIITRDVIKTMLSKNAGTVFVTSDNNIIGLIGQRDILNAIMTTDIDKVKAKEIMSTPIITIKSNQSLINALDAIETKKFSRLAVMKNGQLVAMLSN
ncbi:MAG: CBS domain-containing protein [Candidatus Bathyarchaeum tardum]|nr:MAG: CBS domain-containing protein [Candidatus Bathyarchaeum tardum]